MKAILNTQISSGTSFKPNKIYAKTIEEMLAKNEFV